MSDELTPAEQKYFETGGQAEIPGTPAAETKTEVVVEAKEEAKPAVVAEVKEAKEAPKQEAKAEAVQETEKKEDQEENKKVSGLLTELQQERERRRAEAKGRQESEKQFAALQARLDTLARLAAAQGQQQTEAEIPDVTVDPVGHFKAKNDVLERQLRENGEWRKQQENWRAQQEQQAQAVNNIQRLTQLANAHEVEFRKSTPDYDEASSYMRATRDAELEAYGIKDGFQRAQMIQQDAINIAAQALADSRNPAEVIYAMARARGYQVKAKTAPAAAAQAAPVVQAAPVTASAAQTVSDEIKVAMAAKGQQAGQSIGQVPGGAAPAVTLDSLAKMSDAEFADATKGDKWRKLMGGGR